MSSDSPSSPLHRLIDDLAAETDINTDSGPPGAISRDDDEYDLDEGEAAWEAEVAKATISPRAHEALVEAKTHLDQAWHLADSGTVDTSGAKGQVRRATMAGLKPYTNRQIPFNQETVVSIDRLTRVIEELATRLEVVDRLVENLEDQHKSRAAIEATTSVQIAELTDGRFDIEAAMSSLIGRIEDMEATVAYQRQLLSDAPVRTATPNPTDNYAALLNRLGTLGHTPSEALRRWAEGLAPRIRATVGQGRVVAIDRGEWSAVWAREGLDVLTATTAPFAELAAMADGSAAAVTVADWFDRQPLETGIELLDQARRILQPGGIVVITAADPVGIGAGDAQWTDPARRPVFPALLHALALERGYVETERINFDHPPAPALGPYGFALWARTSTASIIEP